MLMNKSVNVKDEVVEPKFGISISGAVNESSNALDDRKKTNSREFLAAISYCCSINCL